MKTYFVVLNLLWNCCNLILSHTKKYSEQKAQLQRELNFLCFILEFRPDMTFKMQRKFIVKEPIIKYNQTFFFSFELTHAGLAINLLDCFVSKNEGSFTFESKYRRISLIWTSYFKLLGFGIITNIENRILNENKSIFLYALSTDLN